MTKRKQKPKSWADLTDEERDFYRSFTPARIPSREFHVGDEVRITGEDHPAKGEMGIVVEAPREMDGIIKGVWAVVEIIGWAGHQCGVQPRDMRKLS